MFRMCHSNTTVGAAACWAASKTRWKLAGCLSIQPRSKASSTTGDEFSEAEARNGVLPAHPDRAFGLRPEACEQLSQILCRLVTIGPACGGQPGQRPDAGIPCVLFGARGFEGENSGRPAPSPPLATCGGADGRCAGRRLRAHEGEFTLSGRRGFWKLGSKSLAALCEAGAQGSRGRYRSVVVPVRLLQQATAHQVLPPVCAASAPSLIAVIGVRTAESKPRPEGGDSDGA